MRIFSFFSTLAFAIAVCLPLALTSPASAESGAHQPAPPPVDTPIVIDELD